MHRDRTRFIRWVRDRFLLRFHMALILVGTFVAGLVTTKILLELELDALWLRYLIAVVVAYLAFVGLVRVWLAYLAWAARSERDSIGVDALDLVDGMCEAGELFSWSSPTSRVVAPGGESGATGASTSWNVADVSGATGVRGGGPVSEAGVSFGFDLDEAVWILVAAVIVVAVLFVAVYLIWMAPAMLAEVAFEAALASVLVRRAKKAESGGWVRSVIRSTVWPFLAILFFSVVAGWAAQQYCPDAIRMIDAIRCG